MKNIRHLLVDLDGTLLGSRDLFLRWGFITGVIREIKKEVPGAGILTSLRALRAMRLALEAPNAQIRNEVRASRAFGEALGMKEDAAQKLLHQIVKTCFPRLKPHFFPISGASDFLHWAKEHFVLHLATNPVWPREVVELRLKWAGLEPSLFQFIANAEVMHACKPTLEYYRELLTVLKVSPTECLMIGDSEKKDLPAVQVGIPVFLLGRQANAHQTDKHTWKGNFSALRSMLEEK